MKTEREQNRDRYIESIRVVIEGNIGIKPSYAQLDQYVGERVDNIKPGSPPWADIVHLQKRVKLN